MFGKNRKTNPYDKPSCRYNSDLEDYGYSEEHYENLYPTIEEVVTYYENDTYDPDAESYGKIYGE